MGSQRVRCNCQHFAIFWVTETVLEIRCPHAVVLTTRGLGGDGWLYCNWCKNFTCLKENEFTVPYSKDISAGKKCPVCGKGLQSWYKCQNCGQVVLNSVEETGQEPFRILVDGSLSPACPASCCKSIITSPPKTAENPKPPVPSPESLEKPIQAVVPPPPSQVSIMPEPPQPANYEKPQTGFSGKSFVLAAVFLVPAVLIIGVLLGFFLSRSLSNKQSTDQKSSVEKKKTTVSDPPPTPTDQNKGNQGVDPSPIDQSQVTGGVEPPKTGFDLGQGSNQPGLPVPSPAPLEKIPKTVPQPKPNKPPSQAPVPPKKPNLGDGLKNTLEQKQKNDERLESISRQRGDEKKDKKALEEITRYLKDPTLTKDQRKKAENLKNQINRSLAIDSQQR